MKGYNPKKHTRHSIRLKEHDYSCARYYYITMRIHYRICVLGEIINGSVRLNRFGKIVEKFWLQLPVRFENIKLDAFIIMPDHVHGIIHIVTKDDGHDVGAIHELPLHHNKNHELPNHHNKNHELPNHHNKNHELPNHHNKNHELPRNQRTDDLPYDHSQSHDSYTCRCNPQNRRIMLLPKAIGYFKMNSAKEINKILKLSGNPLWQRNYYEHIVRDKNDLDRIRNYIKNNPRA